MHQTELDRLGALVSIEGLNGVGKTYLTNRIVAAASEHERPLVVEEFSRRHGGAGSDLGRRLVRTLVDASAGERFLRGGYPLSETLLLLAVKMHDFEAAYSELRAGRTVIEGRSAHSVAVYQSLILQPDDERAADLAHEILDMAASWRPLPDLTVLITDAPAAAVRRAEIRDAITYTPEQWRIHLRAATLFERLAAADPDHIRTIDRRTHDADAITATVSAWINEAPRRTWQPDPELKP